MASFSNRYSGKSRNAFSAGASACAVATAVFGTLIATPAAFAQSGGAVQMDKLVIEGEGGATAPYKAEKTESPKYTAPLLDTPQTITVVTDQVIRDQNLESLRDILSTVPGITFGAGEGGGGYGDSITLRGYTASTDVTQDGLRDSAQYSRSDSFNVQQVEIVNGANSVFSGSGSLGGSINLVNKTPELDSFRRLRVGFGTDAYLRGTADVNERLTDTIAARFNLMGHKNDVPGRKVENAERWGLAPSLTFGLTTPTQVTLMYFHQHDNNIPQYGVPYFRNEYNNGPLPDVNPADYFGYRNIDRQKIDVDTITAKISHDLGDGFGIRNITRFEQVDQYTVVDPPQGTWCLTTGINPSTGAACSPTNTYVLSGPRGNVRDTKNRLFVDQLDFTGKFDTAGLLHSFDVGAMLSHETFRLDGGNVFRNPGGATPNPSFPNMSITNPYSVWTGPVNFIQSSSQDGTADNQAVYAFDDMKIDRYFSINGGVRWEHNEGTFTSATYTSSGAFSAQNQVFNNADNLFSYRFGLVFKPMEIGSIYIAYGNSKTPSKTSVNGSCTAATCNVKPESGVNYEIGTKWDLMDRRLSLTAALFRNDRSNYKVPSNDPTLPDEQLDGEARVQGIALGASGQVTDDWAVFANYTFLDTEVIQAVSNYCLANPTVPACATALAGGGRNTPIAGNPLTQTPDHAFNLWTTYNLPHDFQVGYGVAYQGEIYLNNGAAPLFKAPGYWVHKAMVAYRFDQFTAQVNVNNLLDEEYYTRIRNNGWATVGDARSATFTLNYDF